MKNDITHFNEMDRIERIIKMEQYLDDILNEIHQIKENSIQTMDSITISEENIEKLSILKEYYQNGTWLTDYEADERGEIPKEIKRGVLSQDSLHNLLQLTKNIVT